EHEALRERPERADLGPAAGRAAAGIRRRAAALSLLRPETRRAQRHFGRRGYARGESDQESRLMKDLKYETLLIEQPAEHVLVVRFNRPEVRNAMSTQLGRDMQDVFSRLIADAGEY